MRYLESNEFRITVFMTLIASTFIAFLLLAAHNYEKRTAEIMGMYEFLEENPIILYIQTDRTDFAGDDVALLRKALQRDLPTAQRLASLYAYSFRTGELQVQEYETLYQLNIHLEDATEIQIWEHLKQILVNRNLAQIETDKAWSFHIYDRETREQVATVFYTQDNINHTDYSKETPDFTQLNADGYTYTTPK